MNVKKIVSRWILDSRGYPAVEVEVMLDDRSMGRAAVPSGASTGEHEALELRDGGNSFNGKGVRKALSNVQNVIAPAVIGQLAEDQKSIDDLLCELDGTKNKSKLGANAILGVSLAVAKAVAKSKGMEFWQYIEHLGEFSPNLPMPMVNIFNGGAHADSGIDTQEFMIVPIGANSFAQCMQISSEVYHSLARVLKDDGCQIAVGDEGGFAPRVSGGSGYVLVSLLKAIKVAGYEVGKDVSLALDSAASEFYQDEKYTLKAEGKSLNSEEMIAWYESLIEKYNIVSLEDPLAEDDWPAWRALTAKHGNHLQIVGDDLLVTNTERIQKAIDEKSANAVLIKLNQIGTLSETLRAVETAQKAGWGVIISHRSGETEDTTISHLAVGTGAGQIKSGSMARSERTAKYNEILRIAEANAELKLKKPF